ncbi:CLCN7 [Lepeophtheirus salmonis]|uniref:Chloride channel protein n=1 Tax=Lepeophtheirus salmonis TaxID=72036 RepID=A0A7R8D3U7_LEPSM|nr:CLCN7 [Lepeophtheirus salmonis]CAF3020282.1 CLCN7 [Lepeophtheirus salmonis]
MKQRGDWKNLDGFLGSSATRGVIQNPPPSKNQDRVQLCSGSSDDEVDSGGAPTPNVSEEELLLTAPWSREIRTSCLGPRGREKISAYGQVIGSLSVTESQGVDATLESLDYDLGSSLLRQEHIKHRTVSAGSLLTILLRWFLLLFIGILPALVATGINLAIETLSNAKFSFIRKMLDHYFIHGSMVIPFVVWILMSWISGAIAGVLVAFGEPQAAGSGIPQIKAYLNGIAVPRLMRLKTLFTKSVGVVFSVVAGLAVGKEGPMIHSGAAIGAGICQGKSSSLGMDFIVNSRFYKIFSHYRNDGEKRDFVACGAAAGVAAAFGAPFGGVLFALEEGNKGVPGKLSNGGLISFGKFENALYGMETFPVLILIGVIGGLLGALYVQLNLLYTKVRLSFFQNRYVKVFDVIYISGLGAAIGSTMFLLWNDCIELPVERHKSSHPLQLSCPGGQYHVMANLWFATPEDGSLHSFGAAAQLSGNVRMMVSLTLIIIESTGNLTYSFPIVIVCMIAKYTGDYFNDGLYDVHSELNGVPYLPWQPPVNYRSLIARDIMTSPLCVFEVENSLEYVWDVLKLTSHNGFPVVEPGGRFEGIILRDHILAMLHFRIFKDFHARIVYLSRKSA